MASRLFHFHLLHFFLVLESSCGKLPSEDLGGAVRQGADTVDRRVVAHGGAKRDVVSVNMFRVYERYSKDPQSRRDGNTVRSFRAVPSEWPQRFVRCPASSRQNETIVSDDASRGGALFYTRCRFFLLY